MSVCEHLLPHPMKFQSKGSTQQWHAPIVMAVLNVTPDSFSDGGKYVSADAAIERAQAMLEEGAEIVDIGGESTRPGAQAVTASQEMDRVIPIIEALRSRTDKLISIDTSKPAVMAAACAAGADIINDVRALQEPGALEAAAQSGAAVCLMHMQGQPRTMQQAPEYENVVSEVYEFLAHRVTECESAGIGRNRILVDPGFGFGKTLAHNLQLLAHIPQFTTLELPVLVGLSRKSMFRELLGLEQPEQRVAASVAAATLAVRGGANIVRTHDVAQTRDAIGVAAALNRLTKV